MEAKRHTITKEMKERFQNAQSNEELMQFIKEEGVELTDEQLESVSGGEAPWAPNTEYWVYCCGKGIQVEKDTTHVKCPICGLDIYITGY